VRIRPTELGFKGILLLSALGVAFLAASYSNLFFLIIAFSGALGALGLWWSVRNPRNLRVAVFAAPFAPAGAERKLGISVSDARGATTFDVAVAIDVDKSRVELAYFPVLRGESRTTATLPAMERGIHTVRAVQCISRFPFGLFQITRRVPLELELVTFPRPIASNGYASAMSERASSRAAAGRRAEVAGLRPFRAGDSPADVHWKASARRGEPIIKERELASEEAIEVLLDRRCSGDDDFEAALSRATTLVLRAFEDQRPLQMRSQDYAVLIHAGHSVDPVLHWLASARPLPADGPPPRRMQGAALV